MTDAKKICAHEATKQPECRGLFSARSANADALRRPRETGFHFLLGCFVASCEEIFISIHGAAGWLG